MNIKKQILKKIENDIPKITITAKHFRENTILRQEEIYINFSDGGLGDHICRCTAVDFLIKKYPFVKVNVICAKYFISLGKALVPSATWMGANEVDGKKPKVVVNAGSQGTHTSLRTHLVDHAFNVIVDQQVDISEKNYIQLNSNVDVYKFNLPKSYAVVTTGYTAKVRELVPEIVNGIVSHLLLNNITPVFLGSKHADVGNGVEAVKGKFETSIDYSRGIDLIDQTSLLEAQKIISEAKLIVGLDNGLLHLAGTTQIPIVFGWSTVIPEHRLPIRNNILGWNCVAVGPDTALDCRGCQSHMNFVYSHDFRNCFYKDYKCTKEMKLEGFKNAIDLVLDGKLNIN